MEGDGDEEEQQRQRHKPLDGFVSAAKMLHAQRQKDYKAVSKAVRQAKTIAGQLETALELAARLCPGSCMDRSSSSSSEEEEDGDETTPLRAPAAQCITAEPPKKRKEQQDQ
jgi:hypothetical protein